MRSRLTLLFPFWSIGEGHLHCLYNLAVVARIENINSLKKGYLWIQLMLAN